MAPLAVTALLTKYKPMLILDLSNLPPPHPKIKGKKKRKNSHNFWWKYHYHDCYYLLSNITLGENYSKTVGTDKTGCEGCCITASVVY